MTKDITTQVLETREDLGALLYGDKVKINLGGYEGLAICLGVLQGELTLERKEVGGFGVHPRFYSEDIRRLDVKDNKIVMREVGL